MDYLVRADAIIAAQTTPSHPYQYRVEKNNFYYYGNVKIFTLPHLYQ